jgi:hypothetical protein
MRRAWNGSDVSQELLVGILISCREHSSDSGVAESSQQTEGKFIIESIFVLGVDGDEAFLRANTQSA